MGKKFMGYDNASELLTAIGAKIKAKYTKPTAGIPKSDLATAVQTSLGKADSAVQPATMSEALAAKQNSLSETQLAAVNSGINSTKVGQIDTNKNNILYALETGAANYAPLDGDNRSGSGYFLNATNLGMNVFTSGTVMHVYCEYTKTTNTQFSIQFTNASGGVISATSLYAPSASASGTISGDVTLQQDVYGYNAYYNGASGNTCTITNVMICPKNVWDAIQKYVPYSVPNYELTLLEAEDRASLAEVVDSGAKNLFQFPTLDALKAINTTGTWNGSAYTRDGVTFTVSNNTIAVSGSIAAGVNTSIIVRNNISPSEFAKYTGGILSGGKSDLVHVSIEQNGSPWRIKADDTGNGSVISAAVSGESEYMMVLRVTNTTSSAKTISSTSIAIMICTFADWKVSQKFVPHRVPITGVFFANKKYVTSTTEISTGVKFTAPTTAIYKITATATYLGGKPTVLKVTQKYSPSDNAYNFLYQESYTNSSSLSVSGMIELEAGGEFEVFTTYANATNNWINAVVEKIG